MKRKTFMYLVLVAILSPLFLSSLNNYVNAETVNDLVVTYGDNLLSLDSNDCSFSEGTLSSKRKIYYTSKFKSVGLWVVVPKSKENTAVSADFTFYDINFNELGTSTIKPQGSGSGSFALMASSTDTPFYMSKATKIPDGTFSFSFTINGLLSNVTLKDLGIMFLDVQRPSTSAYSYTEYIKTRGFVDLCNEFTPTIELEYTTTYSKEKIESIVECIDGCQGNVKDHINIDSSLYLASPSKVGSYTINISLDNDTSNTPFASFVIKVKDTTKPIIEGADSITVPAKTTIDKTYLVSKGFLFKDEYDDGQEIDTTLLLNPSFTSTDVLGEGTLKLTLVDSSNNQIEKTINVKIVDVIPPSIEIKEENVNVSYAYTGGIAAIISMALTITDDYTTSPSINILSENYTVNKRKIGVYDVTIEATDEYNNSSQSSFKITVYDDIPPVVFLNTYKIETDVTIKLTKDDIVTTLINTGVLDKSKTYKISVLNDDYTGNENKVGTYNYQLSCVIDNEEPLIKTLEIKVTDSKEYNGEVISSKIKEDNFKEKWVPLIIASTSLIVGSSIALIIIRRKKRVIKPRKY